MLELDGHLGSIGLGVGLLYEAEQRWRGPRAG
jgi:hypothetical protein